jgi:hypothetical protein
MQIQPGSGLKLNRRVEVTRTEFETPVQCPFGDKVSLDDDQAMDWLSGPQGSLLRGQGIQRRVDNFARQTGEDVRVEQGPNGDGFIGPDRMAHVGCSRAEEGRLQDGPESVYFWQQSQGYDNNLETRYRTEVRSDTNRGTVVILEYGPANG